MGRVFRATDSRLGRDVALKLLPESWFADEDRRARFDREARILAAVSHAYIAALYGVQTIDGVQVLELELVEGRTLAEEIARGRLKLKQALLLASQIAEGIEAAHARGIIHRDLKPSNIKIGVDGRVKILDFGLAKMVTRPYGVEPGSSVLESAGTRTGELLGTPAYMSPEQARGQAVDERADIWALGCVLYEMLTGRQAFEGPTATDSIASVISHEPDWGQLPVATPSSIRRLLRRTLIKDPHKRLGDMHDVRLEIDDAELEESEESTSRVKASAQGFAMAVLMLLVLFLARSLTRSPQPPAAEQGEMRLQVNTPFTLTSHQFALSHDGHQLVFAVTGREEPPRLWLRSLNQAEPHPLEGTEGASFPFWSPDGRSIGFFAATKLYRIDVGGGSPRVIADAPDGGSGAAWNSEGTILFSSDRSGPVFRVDDSGGRAVPATVLEANQRVHLAPRFLPDGRHFLYYVSGTTRDSGTYLGSLDGAKPKQLSNTAGTAAEFLAPDMVLWVHQGALVARRLDLSTGQWRGDQITVANAVSYNAGGHHGGFSTSQNGLVAYRNAVAEESQLTWFDRTGRRLGAVGKPELSLNHIELSPDGRRVAIQRNLQDNRDIWALDFSSGSVTRLTTDDANDVLPVWAPDGSKVAFMSNRRGRYDLYVTSATRSNADELLLETASDKYPRDWSKDGRFLVYVETAGAAGSNLWALDLVSGGKPHHVARTFAAGQAQVSPDGHWIAFETDESGRKQVVAQQFPIGQERYKISIGGGAEPRWNPRGDELYFISPDAKLVAATVSYRHDRLEIGPPRELFQTRIVGLGQGLYQKQQYAVSKDGRFLINETLGQPTQGPITVVLNWHPPS